MFPALTWSGHGEVSQKRRGSGHGNGLAWKGEVGESTASHFCAVVLNSSPGSTFPITAGSMGGDEKIYGASIGCNKVLVAPFIAEL